MDGIPDLRLPVQAQDVAHAQGVAVDEEDVAGIVDARIHQLRVARGNDGGEAVGGAVETEDQGVVSMPHGEDRVSAPVHAHVRDDSIGCSKVSPRLPRSVTMPSSSEPSPRVTVTSAVLAAGASYVKRASVPAVAM